MSSQLPLYDDPPVPLPNQRAFQGPWFSQQVSLSIVIGLFSFFLFVVLRRKNAALFAPRTKLKGFSPLDEGRDSGYFGWIKPTVRTEEMRILQTVGLDAAILLSFLKMGFWLFFTLSCWSIVVLMPVNYWQNGVIDGVSPAEDRNNTTDPNPLSVSGVWSQFLLHTFDNKEPKEPLPQLPLPAKPAEGQLYHAVHLLSCYLFTLLALRAIWKNYEKFVRSRQLYILEIVDSIPARTVEIRDLPPHLRDEKALADYFEDMDLKVESTAVVRKTEGLSDLLSKRSNALSALEQTWVKWLGNPTDADGYDPEKIMLMSTSAQDDADASSDGFSPDARLTSAAFGADDIRAHKPRPMMRTTWWNPFSEKIDALDQLTREFNAIDRAVRRRRKQSQFAGGNVGFVTFQSAASAQTVAQTVHYPIPAYCATNMAQEPRDIIWSNIDLSNNDRRVRQVLVTIFMIAVLVFYIPPLIFLASFVSPGAIHKYLPWLDRLLDSDERLRALVQNNLPSLVLIGFNALLPLVLEYSSYLQGLKARSLVEYSLLKKYYLFLMVSVVFIFLIATTAWGVLQELAENPMRVIDKFAASLPKARFFSLSYVILQGIALQPLQLLQLPTLMLRGIWRIFFTRTPREFAELNAPPTLAMGNVYPQALLIFTLCILYSIVSPLIVIFGAIYFAIAYFVNKYKLLYVFYKPYESQGQAWPISASRCIWALVLFHIFQFSLFSVRKQLLLSTLMLPLLIFTLWFANHLEATFGPLTQHVNLSSIMEVLRGPNRDPAVAGMAQMGPPAAAHADESITPAETRTDVTSSRALLSLHPSHKIDPEHTKLAMKRYSPDQLDETLFVAQSDTKTDYREPPAAGYYTGVLNTGRRRYGHPALTGILPELWLPIPSHRVDEGEEDATAPDDLESQSAQPTSIASATAIGTPMGGSNDTAMQRQGSGKTRPRTVSKSEPLVLSLRKRKGSLRRQLSQTQDRSSSYNNPNSGVWSDGVSGPQGSSSQAAIGEALSGGYAVAPARQKIRSIADNASPDGDAENEDEVEDDDEGVYIHRSTRSRRISHRPTIAPYHD